MRDTMRLNPSLHRNCCSGLCPLPHSGELKRYASLMKTGGNFGIQQQPDAKMVDIRIVEVPYRWKGMAPDREIISETNTSFIKLKHLPSATEYSVEVDAAVQDRDGVSRSRAQAKLAFMRALSGDA